MLHTRIDLSEKAREKLIDLLNARLAELIDLRLRVKQAHWNVRGPNFIAIHEMFDGFAGTLDAHIDVVAERVGQLGGLAAGSLRQVADATTLKAYPAKATKAEQHLEALADAYAAVGKNVRKAIDLADELGDAAAADIFTAASRELDKSLWFIESHLN